MKDKLLTIFTAVLFTIGVGLIIYVILGDVFRLSKEANFGNLDCVNQTMIRKNEDPKLNGIVDEGEQFKVLKNYYACNQVSKDHVVWFRFSKSIEPVVRRVVGIPGDKYAVTEDSSGEGGKRWVIRVNGENVKTTSGQDYFISAEHTPPLKTYEMSRKGLLRENEFILFSGESPSISDSSNFGLIRFEDIAGRVFPLSDAPGK